MLQNRKYDSERNLQRTLRFSGRKTALGNKQKQVTFRTIWNHKNPLWKFWDSGLKRSQSDYELLGIFKAWFSFKFASTFKNNWSNKIKPTKNLKKKIKTWKFPNWIKKSNLDMSAPACPHQPWAPAIFHIYIIYFYIVFFKYIYNTFQIYTLEPCIFKKYIYNWRRWWWWNQCWA